MYLDHLRNNTVAATATASATAVEPSVSFMDCMEAALYCTEVHSAADAYLIKAEATYMANASEDGEGAAKEGFWAKIKKVFKKMWETLNGYFNKVVAFVKNTIKPAVQKKISQLVLKWKQLGMKSKLEKCKGQSPDKSKLEGVKYIEGTVIKGKLEEIYKLLSNEGKNDVLDPKNTDEAANKLNGAKIKELLPNISDEKADFLKAAADLSYENVATMVNDISSGKSVTDILEYVTKTESLFANAKKVLNATVARFKEAEKGKDEEFARNLMKKVSLLREWTTGVSVFVNQLGVIAIKTIVTQANAVNKWMSACGKAEKKEDKKEDKK